MGGHPPDDGGGQSVKEATPAARLNSPKIRTTLMYTARGQRGYWLGRKASLNKGEPRRRLNEMGEDTTCSGQSLNTKGNRVKTRGSRGKVGMGGVESTRTKASTTLSKTQNT